MTDVVERTRERAASPRHYHHGRTPACWAGSMIVFLGIIVGCAGMIPSIHWVVVAIGLVIIFLGGIAAAVLRKLGLGADPVV